jgi:hypothetical protein
MKKLFLFILLSVSAFAQNGKIRVDDNMRPFLSYIGKTTDGLRDTVYVVCDSLPLPVKPDTGATSYNTTVLSEKFDSLISVFTVRTTTFAVKNLTTDSVQLDSNVCKYLNISLKLSCTDTLFIANDSTVSAETGIELLAGDAIRLPCTNTNQFWIKGSGASANTVKLWWEN